MPLGKTLHGPSAVAIAHVEELLDEALNETFPASDPVAINIERPSRKPATFRRGRRGPLRDDEAAN
jgi:hypothetical protein